MSLRSPLSKSEHKSIAEVIEDVKISNDVADCEGLGIEFLNIEISSKVRSALLVDYFLNIKQMCNSIYGVRKDLKKPELKNL